jgi:hypothetical protein
MGTRKWRYAALGVAAIAAFAIAQRVSFSSEADVSGTAPVKIDTTKSSTLNGGSDAAPGAFPTPSPSPKRKCGFGKSIAGASGANFEYSTDTTDFKDVDPKTLTQVPVSCKNDGGSMGRLPCDQLIPKVIKMNRTALATWEWNYYHGKLVDPTTGDVTPVQGPVCNMLAGEIDHNQFNQSCGDFCQFKVSAGLLPPSGSVDVVGSPPTRCARETAWGKGAGIQALNHYKEEVYKEFQAKNLQLVDLDGSRPCAEQAADVIRVSAGRDCSEDALNDKIGPDAAKQTCASSSEQSVCVHEAGNHQLDVLWELLLRCETVHRVLKDAYYKAMSRDAILNEVKGQAIDCALRVAACMAATLGICPDSTKSSIVNGCYKEKVPPFLQSKQQQWWSTSEPVEKPIDPSTIKSDTSKNDTKPSRAPATDPTFPGATAFLLAASLGDFFKRYRKYFRLMGAMCLSVFGLSTFTFFVSTPVFGTSDCNCCNSCDSCCASCCTGCADCPQHMSDAISTANACGSSGDSGSSGASGGSGIQNTIDTGAKGSSLTGAQCQEAMQAQNSPCLSSDQRNVLKSCMDSYCQGVQAPGGPSGGAAGTGSSPSPAGFGGAGSAAPLASQAAGNFNAASDLAKGASGAAKTGGGAAQAGLKAGDKAPTASKSDGSGDGHFPTAGGPSVNVGGSSTGGPAGGGGPSQGQGGGDAGAGLGGGAADAGTGELDSKAAGFDSAGAGGGGRSAGKEGGGSAFGGLFGGGGAGGPQGGVGNANFNAGTTATGGITEADFESMLQKNSKMSLFEIVNHRMEKFGDDIAR